ncbi:PPOX class F420-dependent oxidoreductase [Flexivirga meconopsidis]|uniref:PPOX class F420-dependent oxidoreductase n=1 Tax=Flexivirga meconopsidis TaxID=2977121 RepID=UPI00223E96F5|nr:PPOX class F420-dependent oxidoreductase [Flexivirga meconopsidis]
MTDALQDLIAASHLATLATIRRDGRPQLSNVSCTYDPERDLIRVSITDGRAKTANLRRDPRATLLVNGKGGWSYAAVDATATLLPVAQTPDDASVEELISIYRAVNGEHPDWDDYRAAMVADRRVPLHLHVDRIYGSAR